MATLCRADKILPISAVNVTSTLGLFQTSKHKKCELTCVLHPALQIKSRSLQTIRKTYREKKDFVPFAGHGHQTDGVLGV